MIISDLLAIENRFVCHVTLTTENHADCDILKNKRTSLSNTPREMFEALTGQKATTGIVLNDPDSNKFGLFFLFPDLSIRIVGKFQIACTLIDIMYLLLNSDDILIGSTNTEIFEAFNQQNYPGVGVPTKLSISFAAQGVQAPARRYKALK